jgi:hypothetical protein
MRLAHAQDHRQASTRIYAAACRAPFITIPSCGLEQDNDNPSQPVRSYVWLAVCTDGLNEKYEAVCIQLAGDLISAADEAL